MQVLRQKGRQSDRQTEKVDDKQVQARVVWETDRYWQWVRPVGRQAGREKEKKPDTQLGTAVLIRQTTRPTKSKAAGL